MAHFPFNCNEAPADNHAPIPPGKYPAVIVETHMGEPNEKGTVQMRVKWQITGGPHAGLHVTNYITAICPSSQTAQDIGHRFIKNLCDSVGLASIMDTDELVGRAHIIDVGHQTKKDDADFNAKQYREVKRCYPAGRATTPARETPPTNPAKPAQPAPMPTPPVQPANVAPVAVP